MPLGTVAANAAALVAATILSPASVLNLSSSAAAAAGKVGGGHGPLGGGVLATALVSPL